MWSTGIFHFFTQWLTVSALQNVLWKVWNINTSSWEYLRKWCVRIKKLVNTYNAGLGFTEQKSVCFLIFLKFQRLFHELMNQYQACFYLSECIFHCGFTYGQEIPQFRHVFTNFVTFLTCRLLSPAAWKALKPRTPSRQNGNTASPARTL